MKDNLNAAVLQQWEGRHESIADSITAFPLRALKATLEAPYAGSGDAGEALTPLWHCLYFLPTHAQSALGVDGHARRGGFLPPVPLPRRRWAGRRFGFLAALRVGEEVRKNSAIASIRIKEGRSGALVFVTVRHEIVYREAPGLVVHGPLIATLLLDLLQRELPGVRIKTFTFRAIRPTFDQAPFFVNGAPEVEGKSVRLWASDAEGFLTMDATATLE